MASTGNPFLQMFARSPFKPMQEHIAKAQECAVELIPFIEAVIADDWDKAAILQNHITNLEDEADVMKKEIRQNLPKSIFLPVPRTELLEIVRMQDKIANRAEDIAGLMLGRTMQIPEVIQEPIQELLRAAISTSEQALTALNELDELVSSGFGGLEMDIIEKMLNELDTLEQSSDEYERQARSELFQIEKELHPVDVMFLYQIISLIGDLANCAQQVGSRLQLLVAR